MPGAAAANGGWGGGGGTDAGPQRIVEIKHQLYAHKEEEDEDEQGDLPPLEKNRHPQCHHHHIAAGLLVPSSSPASPSSFTSATDWAQDDMASSSSDPDASSIDSHYGDGFVPIEEEAMAPGDWKQRLFSILVAGTGFLADSYDLFVINLVLLMMKQNESYGVLTPDMQAKCSFMAIIGALCGQLLFGLLGDQYGRRQTFLMTAALTILGNILQATAQPHPKFTIYQQMMVFRFIMGLGVGGEYPAASTITSENSNSWQRGRNLAAVFSMQGVGRLLCALVLLLCAYFISDTDLQWRVAVVAGAIPMMVAIFFRWLPETEVFRNQVEARYPDMRLRFSNILRTVWANRRALAGTAGSWFILDVLFYGNSLFSADVTSTMGLGSDIKGRSVANLVIQSMAMPGYIFTVMFIDKVGKKRLQLFGFMGEGLVFAFMAIYQSKLKQVPAAFLFLYALTFLLDNFGANSTTWIIPAEIFPTEARSTCHGISAAFGKAGAVVGASVFLKLTNMHCVNHMCTPDSDPALVDKGIKSVFYWCAVLSLFGFIWTSVLVHDKRHRSLDVKAPMHMQEEGEEDDLREQRQGNMAV